MPLIRNDLPSKLWVGRGVIRRLGEALRAQGHEGRDAVLIAGGTADRLYGGALLESLHAQGYRVVKIPAPAGEGAKDLGVATQIFQLLADRGFDRGTLLIGFGGGVVTDLAGYVAANYLRGLSLVQIPTTLLAQIDAAVGGKCALNVLPGKNNIGTIYHPLAVFVDPDLLRSLGREHLSCGFAEAIKFGAVLSEAYLEFLEEEASALLAGLAAPIDRAITWALDLKARLIKADPGGEQELLLYGHTLAGALEVLLYPNAPSHGQALAVGMAFATHLAELRQIARAGVGARLRRIMRAFDLPTQLPAVGGDELLRAMRNDKKVRNGRSRFVLMYEPGRTELHDDVTRDQLAEALARLRPGFAGRRQAPVLGVR